MLGKLLKIRISNNYFRHYRCANLESAKKLNEMNEYTKQGNNQIRDQIWIQFKEYQYVR